MNNLNCQSRNKTFHKISAISYSVLHLNPHKKKKKIRIVYRN